MQTSITSGGLVGSGSEASSAFLDHIEDVAEIRINLLSLVVGAEARNTLIGGMAGGWA